MSKKEKPIKIIKGKNKKHKTETRVFAREIHESYCAEPSCKFYGEHSVQGICHTTETFSGLDDWSYIDSVIEASEKAVKETSKIYRKHHSKKGKKHYIKHLESHLEIMWMNEMFKLDELVRLRRENSLLKHENKKLKEK